MKITHIANKLLHNQIITLYIATFAGVALGFVASILNTNMLSPASYGDVRYVQNILQLIALLLLFGFFQSGSRLLALSKSTNTSKQLRGTLIIILLTTCVIMMIATWLLAFIHTNTQIANLFIISIPVCVYPLLINYLNTTAQGDNFIGRLSLARLLPAAIYIAIGYYIYTNITATSEIVILLQWGLYSLVLFIIICSTKPSFTNIKETYRQIAKENDEYGKLLYYGSLSMIATNYLAGILLSFFNQDNTIVGFYTLALTLTMPLAYLPTIIGTAYFKQFAHQDSIPKRTIKNTIIMTSATCIMFMILITPLVKIMYSPQYHEVGIYATLLSIGFSVHGIGDMLNRFLGSHGEGKAILIASIACGICKLLGYVVFIYLWNIYGAIFATVLSSCVYSITLVYFYKKRN